MQASDKVVEDISQLDKNLVSKVPEMPPDVCFRELRSADVGIYGLYRAWEPGAYRRMPADVAESVSPPVGRLCTQTAGGCVRLCTDSDYLILRVVYNHCRNGLAHMSDVGIAGFDLYEYRESGDFHVGTFVPPRCPSDGYLSMITFGERRERELTLNFPPYNGVLSVELGIQESAFLRRGRLFSGERTDPTDGTRDSDSLYGTKSPIVFYGSSISQGACASRPGTVHISRISRALNRNCVNLGFSGNDLGEPEMIAYLASLSMDLFFMAYDGNSPTEELEATHRALYEGVRAAHPTLPIIMETRKKRPYNPQDAAKTELRFSMIRRNFDRGIAAGDQHLYLIDGRELYRPYGYDCIVDTVHPTDLGFYAMAEAFLPVIRCALGE